MARLYKVSQINVGWVERSETQHLKSLCWVALRLTQPTNLSQNIIYS